MVYFFDSHLDFILDNLERVAYEHTEVFHRDNSAKDKRYQDVSNYNMLSD